VESFNGKLRDECLNGEIFETLLEAQVLIECWRHEYNTFRPHSSLGYRPPAPATRMIDPNPRRIASDLCSTPGARHGEAIAFAEVCALHHQGEHRAA
jgi:hypothetical protein